MEELQPRTLVLVFEPLGAHGGMERFDDAFCSTLVKQGIDVVWATCDETKASSLDYELWTPFRDIFGETPEWQRAFNYAKGLWLVLKRACREKRRRPVVVHQQFITVLPLEWCFAFLLRLCRIPRVISPHDTVPFNVDDRMSRLLPSFYRQFDIIISHNQQDLAYLQQARRDPSRVRYVPLGNFNQAFSDRQSPTPAEARALLDLPVSAPVLLFQGRVREEKGLEYLIQALPDILLEFPDAILLIAGQPGHQGIEQYEFLIDQLGVRKRVRTRWEFVPDDQLPAYYIAANVTVLPYTHVFQSAVVLTAYAFRRPVVASDVGGLREQIIDRETGILVPPKDSRALAKALIKVLKDRDLAQRIGEAGHRWAAELGNWDTIAQETAQIYNELWIAKQAFPIRASDINPIKSEADS